VPNILKVLNPLFLDDLRADLEGAGNNPRKLANLRKRLSNIRVFDPACGSGNFLYVALELMKRLEGEVTALLAELGEEQGALSLAGPNPLGLYFPPNRFAITRPL
jgi:hypothetical protein